MQASRFHGLAAATALSFFGHTAGAANVDPMEYQSLLTQAGQRQYVRVQVNLDVDVPLEALAKQTNTLRAKIVAREQLALKELNGSILPSSVWRSGLGQIGVYASPQALARLASSAHVRSFGHDFTSEQRLGVYDGMGQLARIEAEIERNGFADVEVSQNLDNFEFDIGRDGRIHHHSTPAQQAEISAKRPAFLNSLSVSGFPDLAQTKAVVGSMANIGASGPAQVMRLNKDGFYLLKEHADVRSIRLAGSPELEVPRLDPDALAAARRQGYADVSIDLQRFAGYSPLKGKLSASAWKAQDTAIRTALGEVLGSLDPQAAQSMQYFGGIASAQVKLSLAALEKVYQAPDLRILAVTLNKPAATTALAESTVQMNMASAWNAVVASTGQHLTGMGQYIAILDTGVQSSHPFFKDANGISRVTIEGCFGSNVTIPVGNEDVGTWQTLCPAPNADGDQVGPGSGQPYTAAVYGNYGHGTHVAGIAAGRKVPGVPAGNHGGANGVAPDAKVIAVQVFSAPNGGGQTRVINSDMAKALGILAQLGTAEITINMSISKGLRYESPTAACLTYNSEVTDKIALLTSMNIPVVVASGNEGWKNSIGWPACVPNAIKVGAIEDIGATDAGATIWSQANIADPRNFGSDPYFLAPGSLIVSSVPYPGSNAPYLSVAGTSMAAPHVAGVYALVKQAVPGISVANITAWIQANATKPVPIVITDIFGTPVQPNNGQVILKRVKLP